MKLLLIYLLVSLSFAAKRNKIAGVYKNPRHKPAYQFLGQLRNDPKGIALTPVRLPAHWVRVVLAAP